MTIKKYGYLYAVTRTGKRGTIVGTDFSETWLRACHSWWPK